MTITMMTIMAGVCPSSDDCSDDLLNKARPLCDLIKLNTVLAQECVAGKASTRTHVTSDLLNTRRSTWHYTPLIGS
jgi:hypothetical protein